MMSVAPGKIVTMSFDLMTSEGEIIETSDISGPVSFMHGKGTMLPGVDDELVGLGEGEEKTFDLPPEKAFGRREDAPTKRIAKAEFPESIPLEPGSGFEAGMPGGQTIRLEVVEVDGDEVVTRMLHPLAGQTVSMTVRIVKVREATAKEVEAGRAIVAPPAPPPG
jgi:FKBP-type peptidyl-prolyl cis-trans isomerase SlyD